MKYCCCILVLSHGLLGVWGFLPAQGEELQPDLNLLRERVTKVWTLILEKKKADALEYVEPASRNEFVYRREARVLSFTIKDIEVGEDPKTAEVTVLVEVRPSASASVIVTFKERWLFLQDNWFVHIEQSRTRELFSGKKAPVPK